MNLFCLQFGAVALLSKMGCLLSDLDHIIQMTNTIQKKFKVSSTQLLYQSCPYQAITLFVTGPFLDGLLTNQNVFAFKYTPLVLVRLNTFNQSLSRMLWSWWNWLTKCLILAAVLHCSILLDFCFSELQYLFSHWENISSNLSSPWPPEDLSSFGLRLCFASQPI